MARERPTGRDQVREAVLQAAERLFGERGVTDVSMREVAREAGVNHGLLHRHFGNKDDLLAALFERSSHVGAGRLLALGTVEDGLRNLMSTTGRSSYVRVLAAALDAGADPASLASNGEATDALAELLAAEQSHDGDDATDARLVAAATFAFVLGWRHFGGFLVATTGLDDRSPRELDEELTALLVKMVRSVGVRASTVERA